MVERKLRRPRKTGSKGKKKQTKHEHVSFDDICFNVPLSLIVHRIHSVSVLLTALFLKHSV
jgi:hypothetical protein